MGGMTPRRPLLLRLATLSLAVATIGLAAGFAAPRASPAPAEDPVVLELFTSQGCSSCPPANANLARLAARPDVLALSYGVTYWDRLGWPDTFARPEYTARQRAYQAGLGNDNVWTPQIVIDGRTDVVGGRRQEIERAIDAHLAFTGPVVRFKGGGVGLAGGTPPRAAADVWLVRYDPRTVEVPVARGENGGRTLPHSHVVRQLVRLGSWRGETVGFALPAPSASGLSTAVLVQAPRGGPILGVGRLVP